MVSTITTSIFLNEIFVAIIDSIAVFLAVLVFRSDPKDRLNKLYVSMTALMLGWVNFAYIPRILDPAYSAYAILSLRVAWLITPLFFLFLYFVSVGLSRKEEKYWFLTLVTAIIGTALSLISGFSSWIIAGFQTVSSVLTIIYGIFKFPFLIGIFAMTIAILIPLFDQGAIFKDKRVQAFSIGLFIFLTLNGVFNITLPIFLGISRFYFFGDYSTLILLAFIAYAITNHRLFNTQVIAAEMISLFIWTGIFVQFLLASTIDERLLSAGTLVFAVIFGIFLIRSVKKEVEQRERIEKLAKELEETNAQQEILIHFIGHEVKGFLTKDAAAFASLSEGDFGALPENVRSFLGTALAESRQGADAVANILTASNLKKGTVAYAKEPFDLKALAAAAVERERPQAERKNLALSFSTDDAPYQMTGDKAQISEHVLRNLLDNAITYTPSGSVSVSMKKESGRIVLAVKDTGIGIGDEDKKRLFTEGGHGKDSQKVNVHSTGYGLFIAKRIIEAHGGAIRAESEGPGKGATFVVEFPA